MVLESVQVLPPTSPYLVFHLLSSFFIFISLVTHVRHGRERKLIVHSVWVRYVFGLTNVYCKFTRRTGPKFTFTWVDLIPRRLKGILRSVINKIRNVWYARDIVDELRRWNTLTSIPVIRWFTGTGARSFWHNPVHTKWLVTRFIFKLSSHTVYTNKQTYKITTKRKNNIVKFNTLYYKTIRIFMTNNISLFNCIGSRVYQWRKKHSCHGF